MNKLKVLLAGEASYLNTGYASISRELCSRLHATDKYQVAEFGAYGHYDHPNRPPWTFYSNFPTSINGEEMEPGSIQRFESDIINQFGKWRFEDVALHFKPDVVIDYRDVWMHAHELSSPLRRHFKTIIIPACDAKPQREDWIGQFIDSDYIGSYTDFAEEVLKRQGGGKINYVPGLNPGADYKIYSPVADKKAHRRKNGLMEDAFIVGTVMRNQRRKLFPDLFDGFAQFLKITTPEIAKKTYLYLHTSYPDVGWHLPELIKEYGLGHKVLVTYSCKNCNSCFPSFFHDARTTCPTCGQIDAIMANTTANISVQSLASIYNTFDIYVQFANSEGMGLPAVEAASCAIPVIYVNYSGMEDFSKIEGIPINPKGFYKESETGCDRAVGDAWKLSQVLHDILSEPEKDRRGRGYKARKGVLQHFNWDTTAKNFENLLDTIEPSDWTVPALINEPLTSVPGNLSNKDLVGWGIYNVLGESDKIHSYFATSLLKDLNSGYSTILGASTIEDSALHHLGAQGNGRPRPYTGNDMLNRLHQMATNRNHWEAVRTGKIPYVVPQWIRRSGL